MGLTGSVSGPGYPWLRCAKRGPLTGILPDAKYEERTLPFQSGDVLVLYTDGVTDARNNTGEFFGSARLRDVIINLCEASATEIARSIVSRVHHHTRRPLIDDATVLIIRRH